MTKVRVTFRPNGSGKLVQEKSAVSMLSAQPQVLSGRAVESGIMEAETELSAMRFTEEYKPWSSPFQDSIEELEPLPHSAEDILGGGNLEAEEDGEPGFDTPRINSLHEDADWAEADEELDAVWELNAEWIAGQENTQDREPFRGQSDDKEWGVQAVVDWPWSDSEAIYPPPVPPAAPVKSAKKLQTPQSLVPEDVLDVELRHNGPLIELDAARPSRKRGILAVAPGVGKTGDRAGGPSWTIVLLSVVGAILTGAIFGYITLTLFAGGGMFSDGGVAEETVGGIQAVEPGQDGSNDPAPNTDSKTETAAPGPAKPVAAAWPAQTYQLLQYGVFSSKASAEAAASDLKKAGLASALAYSGTDYRVYAGMALDRKGAETLQSKLDGTEVYIKEAKLSAVAEILFAGSAEKAESFDANSSELIRSLAGLAAAQLSVNKPSAVGAEAMSSWNAKRDDWLKEATAFKESLSGKKEQAAAGSLVTAMEGASNALAAYNKAPSMKLLWTVQSKLLEAVFAQRELREAAAASAGKK